MLKQLVNKAEAIGVDIDIKMFEGNGFHYYDQQSNTIMLDSTAEEITMVDIVHEYVHHLQWTKGYKQMMIEELNTKEYDARSYEYHAEIVGLHYNEFLTEDKLNITEILSYYEDIIAYFYENGDCIN